MRLHGRFFAPTFLMAVSMAASGAYAQPTITIAHSEQGRVKLSFIDPFGLPRDTDLDPTGGGTPSSDRDHGCVADVDDGSFTGTPDNGVTIDDLIYFLYAFEMGEAVADVDDGSFSGTPDGGITIDDLLYYLARFEAGC